MIIKFLKSIFEKKQNINFDEYSNDRLELAQAISKITANCSTASMCGVESDSSKDVSRFFKLIEYFIQERNQKNIYAVNINLWKSNSLKTPLLSIWNSIISNRIGYKILGNGFISKAMERISVNNSIGEYVLGDIYTEGELIMRDLESNKLKQKIKKYFNRKLTNKKVIIFVNTLELKETKYINSVLQELKLFFDEKGFCFVLGINESSLIEDGYNIDQYVDHKVSLTDEKTLDIAEMIWTEQSLDIDPSLSLEKLKFIKVISNYDLTKDQVMDIISQIKLVSSYYSFPYFDKYIVISILLINLNPELYAKIYKSPSQYSLLAEFLLGKKATSENISNFSVNEFDVFIDIFVMILTKSKYSEIKDNIDSHYIRIINEYKDLEHLVAHDTNIFNLIAKDINKLKLLKIIN